MRWVRPGAALETWQRARRCGGTTLLPYMPLRHKGHDNSLQIRLADLIYNKLTIFPEVPNIALRLFLLSPAKRYVPGKR